MRPSRAHNAWGDWTRRGTALILLVSVATACAGRGLRLGADGRFRNDELGYLIDAPRFTTDMVWRRISLDDTELAWRTDDGRSMSLSVSCKRTRAKPALLARKLLIGVPRDAVLAAHPVALRGDPGWAQTVETGEAPQTIRLKTVTVVSGGCVYDWVLVAASGWRFDESLAAFDDWWTSFERPRGDDEHEMHEESGESEESEAVPAAGEGEATADAFDPTNAPDAAVGSGSEP